MELRADYRWDDRRPYRLCKRRHARVLEATWTWEGPIQVQVMLSFDRQTFDDDDSTRRHFVLIVLIGLGFRTRSGAGKHTAYSTTLPYTQANTVTNQWRYKSRANVYYPYKRPLG